MGNEDADAEAAGDAEFGAFRDEVVDEALSELAREPLSAYMNRYGDAIEARISEQIVQARNLLAAGYYGPSLVSAGTAIQITIRYMILRPVVQGAFLSDQWAGILSDRVLPDRGGNDRELLPAVLRHWAIDMTRVRMSSGHPVLQEINEELWKRRNLVVHRGDSVSAQLALVAIEAAEIMRTTATTALANAGVTKVEGKWCQLGRPEDPFI